MTYIIIQHIIYVCTYEYAVPICMYVNTVCFVLMNIQYIHTNRYCVFGTYEHTLSYMFSTYKHTLSYMFSTYEHTLSYMFSTYEHNILSYMFSTVCVFK